MGDDGEFVPLTHDILCQCLSQIQLAVGGSGFAFTKLDCSNKELTDLGNKVQDYAQLRHIVLSENKLKDLGAITGLPHVLSIEAKTNEVSSLSCLEGCNLPWCQKLDLTSNKLQALPSLAALQRLRFACFAGNEISSLEGFGDHAVLEELQLQENKLASLKGLGCLSSLKRLVVTQNELTSLEGLNTPALTNLELGKNQLASLEHIGGAPECLELDLRENQISGEDPRLPQLRRLGAETPKLRTLYLGDLRIEAIVCAPQLVTVDEEAVSEEDREAAKAKAEELAEAVKAREEEERAAAEAAAAEAAAAEAAAAEGGEEGS